MKCINCVERQKSNSRYVVRNVPKTGRAARNRLCCKCDREKNGRASPEDQAEKMKVLAVTRGVQREYRRSMNSILAGWRDDLRR